MKTYFIHILIFAIVFTATLSCGQRSQRAEKQSEADSLLLPVQNAGDYERLIELADSLEQTGDISPLRSAYLRGSAYHLMDNIQRSLEVLETAMEMTPQNSEDSTYYFRSVLRLVELRGFRKDYEGQLRLALSVIEELKDLNGVKASRSRGELYSSVGCAQYELGMKDEAAQSFDQSYENFLKTYAAEPSWQNLNNVCIAAFNIIGQFQKDNNYAPVEKWITRHDSIFSIISTRDDVPAHEKDKIQSQNALLHALQAVAQNQSDEAMRALAIYQKTESSKTTTGRIWAAGLLLKNGHYAEAADLFACLDQYLAEMHIELSLDAINELFGDKFKANYRAGRRDSALAVAATIVENLDSAIAKQKKSDAAELATIYKTQQKDAEIAQQQIKLTQQRLWGTLAAMVLITSFFIIYTLYRRRAQKRLAEMKAAQERIESELRIARDIQRSMVPNDFPEYEGLDMYAEMNAAKEVGGDLYGYVLQGDRLHFCVGDVSGKGVPASLFMAQAARLFRTLATEGMAPVDIAVRMNNALCENNDRGMFVTMFIGLLHLDTGRLDFCNCGHNPPVLDGEFLKVQYDNQPLGLWEDDPFDGETIADVRGRQLLVYTDGINEAENVKQELLGNERLLELMAHTQSLTSHEVINMLKDAVEQHRAGAEPNDDLTLMCLKVS